MRPPSRWSILAGCLFLVASLPAVAPPVVPADLQGDALPAGALARAGTARLRHGGWIHAARFADDGKTITSFGADHTFRRWDIATGRQLRAWQRQGVRADFVDATAFSRDGKFLGIVRHCNQDIRTKSVLVCEVSTGKEALRIDLPERSEDILSLTFSPDGKMLATGGSHSVVLYDSQTGRRLLPDDTSLLGTVAAFSPDGRTLATGSDSDGLNLVDPVTRRLIRTLRKNPKGPPGQCRPRLAFSPDGKTIAMSNFDCAIRLWDAGSGKESGMLGRVEKPNHFQQPQWRYADIAFTPDGKTLIAFSSRGDIEVWDLATGKERLRIRARQWNGFESSCSTFAVSADGRTLASWGWENALRLWNLADGKELHPTKAHLLKIDAIALTSDGRGIATGGRDGLVSHWDATTGALRWSSANRESILAVAYAPGGKELVFTRLDMPGMARRDVATGKPLPPFRFDDTGSVHAITYSPSGRLLALTSGDQVFLHDRVVGKTVHVLKGGGAALAFSADGRRLAGGVVITGRVDPSEPEASPVFTDAVRIWDTSTGKVTAAFHGEQGSIDSIALSPNYRAVATAGEDGTVRLWEAATGQERWRAEGFVRVCLSPDGRTLIAGGKAGEILLYDMLRRKELRRLAGHQGNVTALAFSADGRTFASASRDTTALVWSLEKVERLGRKEAGPVPAITEESWSALAADAAKAHRAAANFLAAPDKAVSFLRDRVRSLAFDRARAERWVADLDADQARTRQRATDELAFLGKEAEPLLRQALAGKPSAEVRRSAGKLLRLLESPGPSPRTLQAMRAIEVLEDIGTVEARKILEALARGSADARETQEAKEALARLKGRKIGMIQQSDSQGNRR